MVRDLRSLVIRPRKKVPCENFFDMFINMEGADAAYTSEHVDEIVFVIKPLTLRKEEKNKTY